MQSAHHPRTSAGKECRDRARHERVCSSANREALGVPRITTSVAVGSSAQSSYWRLSGVACPADQELHGYDLLRQGARGAARGRERRQGRAPGTLLAVRDASADDAGDRAATSVPAKGAGAYASCKESCGQKGRGEQDGQQAGAQRPVRQVSCREAPGPPFAAWKAQVVEAAGSGDQGGGFQVEPKTSGSAVLANLVPSLVARLAPLPPPRPAAIGRERGPRVLGMLLDFADPHDQRVLADGTGVRFSHHETLAAPRSAATHGPRGLVSRDSRDELSF